MENYLWFYSTVAQVFAALWAVTGMFAVFRLELLDRKIKDALRSLLDFMLVRFKSNAADSINRESIRILGIIKKYIIREVKESDKKEYFGWDTEILLSKPKETIYIINEYDSYVKKESERIDKQKKEKKENNKQLSDQEKDNLLKEKLFNEFRTCKYVYQNECSYKDDLIKDLTFVTIADGLIVLLSLFGLALRVKLASILILVLLFSIIAIILSAKFILDYCRRR